MESNKFLKKVCGFFFKGKLHNSRENRFLLVGLSGAGKKVPLVPIF